MYVLRILMILFLLAASTVSAFADDTEPYDFSDAGVNAEGSDAEVAPPSSATVFTEKQDEPPPVELDLTPIRHETRATNNALRVDGGWDGSWALLFSMNNILVVPAFLSAQNAFFDTPGIGIAYHLAPDTSLRLGLATSRASNPPTIIEEVVEFGDEITQVRRHSQPATPTSRVQAGVNADFLYRLMPTQVAPYAGLGCFFAWARDDRLWRDDITITDQVVSVDDTTQRWDLGIRALLGAEWRLHPSFAFFAEYELRSSIYRRTVAATSTVTEALNNDEITTTRTRGLSKQSSWFNASTGLAQGFQLGLGVHFP